LKSKKVGAESKERMAPLFKNWKMVELFIPVTRKIKEYIASEEKYVTRTLYGIYIFDQDQYF